LDIPQDPVQNNNLEMLWSLVGREISLAVPIAQGFQVQEPQTALFLLEKLNRKILDTEME
jgi:hypothetical protein